MSQCNSQCVVNLYGRGDEDGDAVTFYCTRNAGHEGPHMQDDVGRNSDPNFVTLTWTLRA